MTQDIPDNFGALHDEFCKLEKASVVILPIPYEGTVSYGKGAKSGPRAIIKASQNMEVYDEELDCVPCEVGIHTAKPIVLDSEEIINEIKNKVKGFLDNQKFIISIGGEHSVTLGSILALKEKYPDLSVLQLDAHADLRDSYEDSKHSHACIMRRINDLDIKTAQVGIRSMDSEEAEFIKEKGLKDSVFYAKNIKEDSDCINKILGCLTDHVFITIDVDVFDPSIMPSTGTPEPGGLLWYETLNILKEIFRQKHIVGFDVCELAPIENLHAPDFTVAKLIYKLIGCNFFKDRL